MQHDPTSRPATAALTAERQALSWADEPRALWRIVDIDFTRPLAFVLLAIAYVASRAPFINIGYGTDPDAWRVALSSYWLWDHGQFYPSRLPGYPVQELASAAVIKLGGHLATNSLTAGVSLIGLWFFANIVAELRLPNRGLLVAGYALTPLLWINSMTTMDYMWALTFILGAYYFLLVDRTLLAPVMFGLAMGSRLSSAVLFIPFVVYLWGSGQRHEIRSFAGTSIAITLIAYSPVLWEYGPGFLQVYDAKVGYLNVMRLLGKDCLGLIGAIAVIIATAVSLPRLGRLPRDFMRDRHVTFWVLAIVLTVVTFLRLPHEAAYLVPVYPFGFFIMARYFHRIALTGAIAAIVLAGFVDLTSPGDEITTETFTNAQLGRGLVLSNKSTMDAQLDFTRDIERYATPPNSVVLVGFVYPQLAVRNRDRWEIGIIRKDKDAVSQLSDRGKTVDNERNITYVWLLEWDEFDRLREQGKTFLYTEDAGRSSASLFGYRPGLFKATLLDLGRSPSGGAGAARTDR